MWPFTRKKPDEKAVPPYWVSPFYLSWRCNGCGIATSYETKECPRCCGSCGCETFTEAIGRERIRLVAPRQAGRFFPRGLDVPLND